ncbi:MULTISPECIES: hypothetical protein [unclassified Sporosarcina]|uniref:hypothetical protein n=1 Tax=unclassified Sporosarcina TaxID=2647733 RepID=UPI00203B021E|nr:MULTISPECIES: hypothetical protein [unclassified Sporosarcina]GKV65488.1 hypothetical protein NCCP2331_16410 [Sporosarcina sp. NCCP-2331]GLB55613.1 hypothetical protein NCCP2378_14000 [Sporosarcina sp. NCCP-2378]
MKRTNDKGVTRQVAFKTINCKICGDEQQAQIGSVCHRDSVCIMCANHETKSKKNENRYKKFEVQ